MYKKLISITLGLIVLMFIAELVLRKRYGFCNAILYREDTHYEYIPKANQNIYRFRKHSQYNAQSMRSNAIKDSATIILGFGDSVLNGGSVCDQDSLASTILSDKLSIVLGKEVQFLNISAGSWGPDNCYAYLNKHGDFGSSGIYLVVSSHDAYDNMNFEPLVGKVKSFPDKQYKVALVELFDRYLYPKIITQLSVNPKPSSGLGINKKTEKSIFNSGFRDFKNYCSLNSIPFIIYLHASQIELKAGSYNEQGQEIINFATNHNIPVIKDLELNIDKSEFRDQIHLSEMGQRKMAERILTSLDITVLKQTMND